MRHIKVDTLSMTRAKSISILCAVLGLDSILIACWPTARENLKDVTILRSTVDWRLVVYFAPMLVSAFGVILALLKPRAPIWAFLNGVVVIFWAILFVIGPILSSYDY